MNQNFNYNKEVYNKSASLPYREYWIDPNLGRPWTFLEERMMKKLVEHPNFIPVGFFWSKTFQAFWPDFLVKFVSKHLVNAEYLEVDSSCGIEHAYCITNIGQCTFSRKRAYEM